ncbi:MAG: MATE family efflux transporter [Eubacteriales bacterium]
MESIKENRMGTAPIIPLMLSMSLPAMFSMLVQALYNIVDSMFVAQLGDDAFSAISLAFPLQMIMVALGVGTGVGINSLVARRLGEGHQRDADAAATHGLILALANWMVMVLVGIFLARPFFMMYSPNNLNIVNMGTTYIQIATIFSFGAFVQINTEKTLQATGNMLAPMCSQLIGCVTNIILDPILIFGMFGAPRLEMAGAAIATVLGQILGMCFCLSMILFRSQAVHYRFKRFRWKWRVVRDIYVVGIPAIVMQAIASVMVTLLNKILIGFSESAVNVLGAYYKLQSFVFMPVFGLNQGVMPILGYNFGAGNRKRLMNTLRYGLIAAVFIMGVGTLVFWLCPTQLLSIFISDSNTLAIGAPAMRTISLSFLLAAVNIMLSTLFQAVGMGQNSLWVSLIRQLICILPAAWALSKISLTAVWYAFPLAEIVAILVSIWMLYYLYHNVLMQLQPVNREQTA